MPNPNDGTQLGTSEVIADEYIDPTEQAVRLEPLVPVTGYKLPRSKIAVGPYGVDGGDAAPFNALPVESRQERLIQEQLSVSARDAQCISLQKFAAETVSFVPLTMSVALPGGSRTVE